MSSILKVDQIQLANGSTPTAGDLGLNTTGSVLQVKNAEVNSVATYSNSASASDIAGLTINITPKFSNSYIYITCHISYSTSNQGCGNQIRLKRDGTHIARGFHASTSDGWFGLDNNFSQPNSSGLVMNASGFHLDQPNTTSQVTYQVEHYGVGGTSPLKLCASDGGHLGGVCTLTVMEIAG